MDSVSLPQNWYFLTFPRFQLPLQSWLSQQVGPPGLLLAESAVVL